MKKVKIAQAKNSLSELLRHVRRGGRVRIYDRDEPVADLVPVEPEVDEADGETLLESLVRRGIADRPRETGRLPPELMEPGPEIQGESIVETLLRERQEREDAVLGLVRRRSPRHRHRS